MDTDIILVIGILLGALALPSMLSAYSEGRPPRTGAILVLISSVLIVVALTQKPTGYSFRDIPNVFVEVIARALH